MHILHVDRWDCILAVAVCWTETVYQVHHFRVGCTNANQITNLEIDIHLLIRTTAPIIIKT